MTPLNSLNLSSNSFTAGLTTYWTTSLSRAVILSLVSFSIVLASRMASESLSCITRRSCSTAERLSAGSASNSSWLMGLPFLAGTTASPLTVFFRMSPFSMAFCSSLKNSDRVLSCWPSSISSLCFS